VSFPKSCFRPRPGFFFAAEQLNRFKLTSSDEWNSSFSGRGISRKKHQGGKMRKETNPREITARKMRKWEIAFYDHSQGIVFKKKKKKQSGSITGLEMEGDESNSWDRKK
jgi:hypothetical protein